MAKNRRYKSKRIGFLAAQIFAVLSFIAVLVIAMIPFQDETMKRVQQYIAAGYFGILATIVLLALLPDLIKFVAERRKKRKRKAASPEDENISLYLDLNGTAGEDLFLDAAFYTDNRSSLMETGDYKLYENGETNDFLFGLKQVADTPERFDRAYAMYRQRLGNRFYALLGKTELRAYKRADLQEKIAIFRDLPRADTPALRRMCFYTAYDMFAGDDAARFEQFLKNGGGTT